MTVLPRVPPSGRRTVSPQGGQLLHLEDRLGVVPQKFLRCRTHRGGARVADAVRRRGVLPHHVLGHRCHRRLDVPAVDGRQVTLHSADGGRPLGVAARAGQQAGLLAGARRDSHGRSDDAPLPVELFPVGEPRPAFVDQVWVEMGVCADGHRQVPAVDEVIG